MINKEIKKAIEILKRGGIVVFPTDTAYGVGCRMDDEKAVARLFKIRKRPKDQAVPVLIDSLKMAEKYSKLVFHQAGIKQLMDKYWPGAITIVVPCKKEFVPTLVRGGGKTIGLRIPNHEVPLALIKELGVPILGPSANFHGEPTPYSFGDLDNKFIKLVDCVIKGECPIKQVSTVIDVSQKKWRILRQGAVVLKGIDNGGKVTLIINTADSEKTKIGIEKNGKKYFLKELTKKLKAQNTLPLIDKILKKYHLTLKNIKMIKVNRGKGSFTGLRVGISIANALSFSLGIPVNNKKKGVIEKPNY